jgi:hypothetical protein
MCDAGDCSWVQAGKPALHPAAAAACLHTVHARSTTQEEIKLPHFSKLPHLMPAETSHLAACVCFLHQAGYIATRDLQATAV